MTEGYGDVAESDDSRAAHFAGKNKNNNVKRNGGRGSELLEDAATAHRSQKNSRHYYSHQVSSKNHVMPRDGHHPDHQKHPHFYSEVHKNASPSPSSFDENEEGSDGRGEMKQNQREMESKDVVGGGRPGGHMSSKVDGKTHSSFSPVLHGREEQNGESVSVEGEEEEGEMHEEDIYPKRVPVSSRSYRSNDAERPRLRTTAPTMRKRSRTTSAINSPNDVRGQEIEAEKDKQKQNKEQESGMRQQSERVQKGEEAEEVGRKVESEEEIQKKVSLGTDQNSTILTPSAPSTFPPQFEIRSGSKNPCKGYCKDAKKFCQTNCPASKMEDKLCRDKCSSVRKICWCSPPPALPDPKPPFFVP